MTSALHTTVSLPEPTPRIKRPSTDMALSVSIVDPHYDHTLLLLKAQAYIEATLLLPLQPKDVMEDTTSASMLQELISLTTTNPLTSLSLYAVKDVYRNNERYKAVQFDASMVKGDDDDDARLLVLKQCVHPVHLPKGAEIESFSFAYSVAFHDICHRRKQFDVLRFETLDGVSYDFFDFFGKHVLVNDEDKVRAFVDEQVRLGLEDGRIDKMIQARREWKYEQTLAPGEYYIGDPCYLFYDDDKWMALLHASDWFTSRSQSIANVPLSCHHTAHGDGVFYDDDMHSYGVDSGNLGIIPTSVVTAENGMNMFKTVHSYGRIVTFAQPFVVKAHAGVFTFGDIKIDTRSSDTR